jgi:hypothetical protein
MADAKEVLKVCPARSPLALIALTFSRSTLSKAALRTAAQYSTPPARN